MFIDNWGNYSPNQRADPDVDKELKELWASAWDVVGNLEIEDRF